MGIKFIFVFMTAVGCVSLKVRGQPDTATEDLLIAVYHNDYTTARDAIVRHADLEWRNGSTLTPLHVAAANGYTEVLAVLLVHGANKEAVVTDTRDRPLHLAAANGHLPALNVLVAAGADLHAEGYHGMTPFLRAANNGQATTTDFIRTLLYHWLQKPRKTNDLATGALFAAVENNNHLAVAQAIESGADVDRLSGTWTPLCRAAYVGYLESMNVLLKAGANKEVGDKDSDRPLHDAALKGQDAAVALLAAAGANLNAPGHSGKTPIQRAKDYSQNTKLLLSFGLL